MDVRKQKTFFLKLAVFYWVLVIMIYAVAHTEFHYTPVSSESLSPVASIGELVDGMEFTQLIQVPVDRLDRVSFMVETYDRQNSGILEVAVTDSASNLVAKGTVDISTLKNWEYADVQLDCSVENSRGKALTLTIVPKGCEPGGAVSLCYGNMISIGRADIPQSIPEAELFRLNGQTGGGKLCMKLGGVQYQSFYRYYWPLVFTVFAVAFLYVMYCLKQSQKGRSNSVVLLCTTYEKYGFLLKQLVSRDFKSKYKRSVLGMAWSLLNPLLTMAVQYLIFSTLFRSDIENFPVYLISGIVFFNFFNDAVTMGMTSITSNAALIKKVYMPKYIYPISRILSSFVNFTMAILPMFLVMFVTGTPMRPAMLLLVFDILCMLGFITGMVFLMTTTMTFFQDTQFLWGVFSMIWMYMTPLFYPESIIPKSLLTYYRMNPMYQYITFARTCIIDGISPAPLSYLWCVLCAVVTMVIGIWQFRKHQDNFIMYL